MVRNIIYVAASELDSVKDEEVHNVVIRFDSGVRFDLGAFAYARHLGMNHRLGMVSVDPDSWCEHRANFSIFVIKVIKQWNTLARYRETTIISMLRYVKQYLEWVNEKELGSAWSDPNSFREIIVEYSNYLRDAVSKGLLSFNAASLRIEYPCLFMREYFNDDGLCAGLNLFKVYKNSNPTCPPTQEQQARLLTLCEAIFFGSVDLIINERNLPYPLAMPAYLGYENNIAKIYPANSLIFCSDYYKKGLNWATLSLTGESCFNCNGLTGAARWRLRYSQNARIAVIKKENVDKRGVWRQRIASFASQCFLVMFMAETGMNWSVLTGLHWSDDFEVDLSGQAFRGIKYRAGGKEVYFRLSLKFAKKFYDYISIRKFILGGRDCDFLFFTTGQNSKGVLKKIVSPSTIFSRLRRLDPKIENLPASKWRAAKADWLIANADLHLSAEILQNEEKTFSRNYMAGSFDVQLKQMGEYFRLVSRNVTTPAHNNKNAIDTPIGSCIDNNQPLAFASDVRIKPDCISYTGCLFCENYIVHDDDADIRKLLSCRYLMSKTGSFFGNDEEFRNGPGFIIERIDQIVDKLAQSQPAVVDDIKRSIFENGELDDYWSAKIQLLQYLGVI